jgi:prepilin-type processing-associated H-X9-DG protein
MQGIQKRTKLFQNLKQPIPFPQGVNKYTDLQLNFLYLDGSAVELDNYY